MKQNLNIALAKLDKAVQQGRKTAICRAHKELWKLMQDERNPAPDWDKYPIGRDFWLQIDPVEDL